MADWRGILMWKKVWRNINFTTLSNKLSKTKAKLIDLIKIYHCDEGWALWWKLFYVIKAHKGSICLKGVATINKSSAKIIQNGRFSWPDKVFFAIWPILVEAVTYEAYLFLFYWFSIYHVLFFNLPCHLDENLIIVMTWYFGLKW